MHWTLNNWVEQKLGAGMARSYYLGGRGLFVIRQDDKRQRNHGETPISFIAMGATPQLAIEQLNRFILLHGSFMQGVRPVIDRDSWPCNGGVSEQRVKT